MWQSVYFCEICIKGQRVRLLSQTTTQTTTQTTQTIYTKRNEPETGNHSLAD